MSPLRIVDLFAGGGGASEGIRLATGQVPDLAINHDAHAVLMHSLNHPETVHLCKCIHAVSPREAWGRRRLDLLWASPDCFPAGTMVLTSTGYREIETIRPGDLVLTHLGKWKPVTATMSASKPTRTIRGHGHPGLRVSGEHPFWTVRCGRRWNNGRRGYDRTVTPPEWTAARNLKKGHFWATPVRFEPLPVPEVPGRTLPLDVRLWWLVGRYLADGWTRINDTRAELVICCGPSKESTTRAALSRWPREGTRAGAGELPWTERRTRTEFQFTTNHRGLVAWLREHFGHLSHLKRIPGWVYGLPEEERRAILAGYLSGDGWDSGAFTEVDTASRALAFGIKSLVASLGQAPTVHLRKENCTEIEGRTINARPTLKVRWRNQPSIAHRQYVVTDLHAFTPVREATDDATPTQVFNLSVEGDESYVVEGIVVHNCTHHSRARGGKPRDKGIRDLAWVVVDWAREVRPRVICLENVQEFQEWGPLDETDRPIRERRGETFREFVGALQALGYQVEWRILNAADYGAPTARRRLFLVARCDGEAIRWPEPTHGPGRIPYRTAAECIDWSIPIPSVFDRKRPLAEATQRRIAEGIRRYVLQAPRPFIVQIGQQSGDGGKIRPVDAPLSTIVTKAEHLLVAPMVAKAHSHGWDRNGGPIQPADRPIWTVTAKEGSALVAAFLAKHYGGVVGTPLDRPLGTITSIDHHSLVGANLVKLYGTSTGAPVDAPLPTVTGGGGKGGGHLGLVAAFMTKFYGTGSVGQAADEPLHTITGLDRFGLVTVTIDGEEYALADIGMRMLQPRELARAQGFSDSYILTGTKAQQVERIGNSVSPHPARALVAANLGARTVPGVQYPLFRRREAAVAA